MVVIDRLSMLNFCIWNRRMQWRFETGRSNTNWWCHARHLCVIYDTISGYTSTILRFKERGWPPSITIQPSPHLIYPVAGICEVFSLTSHITCLDRYSDCSVPGVQWKGASSCKGSDWWRLTWQRIYFLKTNFFKKYRPILMDVLIRICFLLSHFC